MTEITEQQVWDFANRWFKALDVHTPANELQPFLFANEFVLVAPEGEFDGLAGFSAWYERALHLFFDETHTLTETTLLSQTGDEGIAKVVVNWKASVWKAPEPSSKRIEMDAYQTWSLRLDGDGHLRIFRYLVDDVQYAPGSARL